VLAAEGPEGVVGYCAGALVGEDVAEVSTLYLLKSAQGLGLGGRLLAACARVLQARKARSMRLWVLDGNVRARGFYEHLGGVGDARRPVNGWGGGLTETAYRWADIGVLARR
jgi:ribosomal protein S18 acetylase RimI-like enzyme